MSGSTKQIVEIQYLRAVAVLLVLFGHAYQNEGRFFSDQTFGPFLYFGFSGVDVFFVISGFIIHTLYRDREGLRPGFFLHRLNRIFPMYWLFTLGALLGYGLVLGGDLGPVFAETDWLRTLTLWPTGSVPILPVAWTLTHEIYFYFVYMIYLATPARWRGGFALGWLGITLLGVLAGSQNAHPVLALVLSPFNLLFIAGAAIAEYRSRLVTMKWPVALLCLVGAGMGLFWTGVHGLDGLADPVVRVAVFAPFAIGIVWAFLAWKPHMPVLFARIGDWSYVLYLGHTLVLDVVARALAPRLDGQPYDSVIFYASGIMLALLMSAIAHHVCERPALQLGKTAIRRVGL